MSADNLTDEDKYWRLFGRPKATPEPQLTPPAEAPAGGTAYGRAALADEARQVAATPEGQRNARLNAAAFSVGRLIAGGQIDPAEAQATLTAAGLASGLTPTETAATVRSGLRGGGQSPRVPPELPEHRASVQVVSIDEITGEVTEQDVPLWEARPILAHLRSFALARMVSPCAVLGVTLLRALALVPPTIVLPALIGGHGSLNAFVALVGPSGVGKGAAEATAAEAIRWPGDIYTAPVGSGEGIAHQYAHRERGEIIHDRHAVLFSVPEVDTLTALGGRQGATLLTQLRSAFSGERLGYSYADPTRRIPIERHSYRLGMTVGVQPEKAGPLLGDADGGTPQRFVWLPATDTQICADVKPAPEPWRLELPAWGLIRTHTASGLRVADIPDEVARYVRERHAARARGEGDTLDGHATFARLKVAYALAVLDGRPNMEMSDWDISGAIMRISDSVRKGVTETLTAQRRAADQAREESAARRAVAESRALDAEAIRRVSRSVTRRLVDGPVGRVELTRAAASRDREHLVAALDQLLAAGEIEAQATAKGTAYSLAAKLPTSSADD